MADEQYIPLSVLRSYSPHPDKLDLTGLTQEEITHGIKSSKLPDYIRYKQYLTDTNEALAQLAEMIIQFAVNLGLDPDQTLDWARKLQQAVPQSEFDSWIATLLDGGPSIFVNTLSELQAKYPNGAAGVALVRETDPAKIYVWNGSAWEDFGDYQGIEVKDGTITASKLSGGAVSADKTDFLSKRSYNMLDTNTLVYNTILNPNTGVEMNYEGYSISGYIEIKPNTDYSLFYASNFYWFDKNRKFISSVTGATTPKNFTSPSNAKFIRVTQGNARPYQMLVEGTANLTEFKTHEVVYSFEKGGLDIENISGEFLLERNKGVEKHVYNLFSLENLTLNATLNANGTINNFSGFDMSDYIEVKPSTTYRRLQALNYFWFDKDKKVITYGMGGGLPTEITSPANAKYIRQNVRSSDHKQTLVEVSYPDLGYIPYTSADNSWYTLDIPLKTPQTESPVKQFSIIGDSFSTFQGWIPEGHATWYANPMTNGNDVDSVKKTWWYMLSKETGLKLLTNDSWSGSTVATASQLGTVDESQRAFVTRFHKYAGSGNVTGSKPDIIFILGGTNDSTKNTEVGTPKYSDWTTEDDKKFAPAFAHLISDVKDYNPTARIINITNGNNKSEIKSAQATICDYYEVENVVISGYSSTTGHPNSSGMITIKNAVKGIL